jgi:hypothetical protein
MLTLLRCSKNFKLQKNNVSDSNCRRKCAAIADPGGPSGAMIDESGLVYIIPHCVRCILVGHGVEAARRSGTLRSGPAFRRFPSGYTVAHSSVPSSRL